MRTFIIKIGIVCALAVMCWGCKVNDGENRHSSAYPGKMLFDYTDGHLKQICPLAALAIALDEYLLAPDTTAQFGVYSRYLTGLDILDNGEAGYVIKGNRGNIFSVRIKDGLMLGQPGAEWQVFDVQSGSDSYKKKITLTRRSADSLVCRYSDELMSGYVYGTVTSAAEWLLEKGEQKDDLLIRGSGQHTLEQSMERVDYRIADPLVFDRVKWCITGGEMALELYAPDETLAESAVAEFEKGRFVRIYYEGASDKFAHTIYRW